MSHTVTGQTPGRPTGSERKRGIFGRIWLFIRQVVGELKKVVTPSRRELVNYVLVVLVFVAFMMVLISLLDLGFGQLAIWLFGNGNQPQ
ncbi:preprotein translocase subunit SecE [Kocuria rhizophila]|uniref:Protein translocase subunit SecE n=1 Tax=Kocuria rhizophila (strain ATCC 9341 / DSM 348 / NBRC 103217 / DC2201) TaxID=378753 RepID=B2GII1_KOCRD|nr:MULTISPECIES: preprotein translocase subunit SecE [Kocuria]HAG63259.1 preprotein translocase subunit SecE [Kocuria sp.]ASE11102.1 preprotein translocase subunit SecE [Kocuria rhizophila]MBK4119544.1 preprotein translocase subunit SecE [Kocuria rhizophila]MCC5671124.1 preprotein translocase subunit SecE [Kocuria rhizophila]MCC5675277.1 preprotein translocase subunit SecE [Kocuria rhizophila]